MMWGDLFCSVATFYFSAGQEHLIAYFSDIAAAIDLPILVNAFPASLASRRVIRTA
jgi:dihydrodipicolinate synthase/N-acetylneuraminate lyase